MDLQFVNMNAATQAERQSNRKIIRSTAMRSFRRKQHSQRNSGQAGYTSRSAKILPRSEAGVNLTKFSQLEDRESLVELSEAANDADVSDPTDSTKWEASGSEESSYEGDHEFWTRNHRHRLSQIEGEITSSPSTGSPVTPLGAGRIDPFRVFSADPGGQISELIDHCK